MARFNTLLYTSMPSFTTSLDIFLINQYTASRTRLEHQYSTASRYPLLPLQEGVTNAFILDRLFAGAAEARYVVFKRSHEVWRLTPPIAAAPFMYTHASTQPQKQIRHHTHTHIHTCSKSSSAALPTTTSPDAYPDMVAKQPSKTDSRTPPVPSK